MNEQDEIIMAFEKLLYRKGPNKVKALVDTLEDMRKKFLDQFDPYQYSEGFTVMSQKTTKARLDTNCSFCDETIHKGDYYFRGNIRHQDGMQTDKYCFGCLMEMCSDGEQRVS